MLSELPKLFDRNFAIGFFLPVAIFIIATSTLLGGLTLISRVSNFLRQNPVEGLASAVVLTWGLAICLVALNRILIRFLEGYYWPLNRSKYLKEHQIRRWEAISIEIEKVEREWLKYQDLGKEIPRDTINKRADLMRHKAEKFPDREDLMLPTSLGNTIRSFERYPNIMYGLEGIHGWYRLLGIMSKEFVEHIQNAKARLDLWINVFYLTLLFAVFSIVKLGILGLDWWGFLPAVAAALIAIGAYGAAESAARQWGHFVKAAFDLYLDDLAKKLGHQLPPTANARRLFWEEFSRSIVYHDPFAHEEGDIQTSTSPPLK